MTTSMATESQPAPPWDVGDDEVRGRSDYPLSSAGRWALVVWAGCLTAGFGLAAGLKPDPRGYGTHQQLGLPPCSLRLLWGIPCPSCGGTTAFAGFVHGDWAAAAQANLSALGLAIVFALMIPWSLMSAWSGRLWFVSRPDLWCLWCLVVFLTASVSEWLVRLAVTRWA